MERLERKRIYGQTYYYCSVWGWKDGRCRRLSQKYLGKVQDILQAVQGVGPAPQYAEVFAWGLPLALWQQARDLQVAEHVERLCPKREQGLSTGDYLQLAAVNRACHPVSKQAMWDWLAHTCLVRRWPQASPAALTSQRFWDHMDRLSAPTAQSVWQNLIAEVLPRQQIDLSQVCYDGTNFYTFIDTFNVHCALPKRGKNKQGRCNLRQVSYALFCSTDGQVPLFYEVYEGNRNDAKEFPRVLEGFHRWWERQAPAGGRAAEPTLIFDKGNNSADNFALVDAFGLHYVGSVKLDEHPDLAQVSNQDARWRACAAEGLEGAKSWRTEQEVYGKQRTLVATYNESLFASQWATVQNDLAHALGQLAQLQQSLRDREAGRVAGGLKPTAESVRQKCRQILHRQHLGKLVNTTVTESARGVPQLAYAVETAAVDRLRDTHLGKTILITDRADWSDEQVIRAYRSQFIIEEVFRELKDRDIGSWWPLNHWTDSKIQVHGLYCTIAVLLRALLWRRVRQAGVELSLKRLLSELDQIQEVVNVYPAKRGGRPAPQRPVLSKLNEVQAKLVEALGLRG